MRDIVINLLRKAQKKHGYLSEDVLKNLSKKHNIPVSRLYGVASFYTQLHTEPQGKNIIEICGSPSCYLNGEIELDKYLEQQLKIEFFA